MKVEKKMLHFKERKKILRKMISTTITTKQRTHDTLMKNKFGFSTLASTKDMMTQNMFRIIIIYIGGFSLLKAINILCEKFYHYLKWLKLLPNLPSLHWAVLRYITNIKEAFIPFCIFIAQISKTAALILFLSFTIY